MGDTITINTNRVSSSFTHTLSYSFSGASGTIDSDVGASTSWKIPDMAIQIPNATSGTGTITCTTYNGSAKVGTAIVSFKATVPSSVGPSVSSITLTDPKGYASTYGGYVQGQSQLKTQVSSFSASGATITSTSITALGSTVNTNPWTSNTITESGGNKTVSVNVTDSRGRTATKTASFTVLSYTSPKITKLTASRCNSDGTANDEGEYINIHYAGNISALNDKNDKNVTVRYKQQDSNTWTTVVNIAEYSVDSSVVVPADTEKSYDISFILTDTFSSVEKTWSLSSAYTLIDFNASGKGVAIGKVSERDALEINMDVYINGVLLDDYIRNIISQT